MCAQFGFFLSVHIERRMGDKGAWGQVERTVKCLKPSSGPSKLGEATKRRTDILFIHVLALNFQGRLYGHEKTLKSNTKTHPYLTCIHRQSL